MIEARSVNVGTHRLYAALHRGERAARAGLLLCPPLLEERKGALRPYVELASRLIDAGLWSMRFDYRGSGDSEGDQEQMSFGSCQEDIAAAFAELRRAVATPLFVLGARLGGALAATAAHRLPDLAGLLLWQPVGDGAEFFRLSFRRHLFRRSLIGRASRSGEPDAQAESGPGEDVADLDGFLLQRRFCEELREISLARLAAPPCPTAVFQVSFAAEPLREFRTLADCWHVELRCLRGEPFWDRIGYVDCSELIGASADWLCRRLR